MLRRSLAVEIDGFIRYLNDRLPGVKARSFTPSAFTQNRKKIDPSVFKRLSEIIIENLYTADNGALKYLHGLRILAVDGSRLTLPFTAALKRCYGVTRNQSETEIVQARTSVLYDVLNNIVLDAVLDHLGKGERELALRHSHRWTKKDLIVYDRGYPSYEFISEHIKQQTPCLIRVKTTHSFSAIRDFIASGKRSAITEIYPREKQSFKDKAYDKNSGLQVRLLRIDLPGGEPEILLTTLLDSQKYPAKLFKELYFLRWGVETFYDELKNKLKVEHFTGYSEVSIQQDLFCAIFISNLQSVIVNDMEEELTDQNQGKKYNYKINDNLSYGFLKNRVLELLYQQAPLDAIFRELQALFLKHTVPIRNDRKNPRHTTKYKNRIKPKVPKNQKDAI